MFFRNPDMPFIEYFNNNAKLVFWLALIFTIACVIGYIRTKNDPAKRKEILGLFFFGSILIVIAVNIFVFLRPLAQQKSIEDTQNEATQNYIDE